MKFLNGAFDIYFSRNVNCAVAIPFSQCMLQRQSNEGTETKEQRPWCQNKRRNCLSHM